MIFKSLWQILIRLKKYYVLKLAWPSMCVVVVVVVFFYWNNGLWSIVSRGWCWGGLPPRKLISFDLYYVWTNGQLNKKIFKKVKYKKSERKNKTKQNKIINKQSPTFGKSNAHAKTNACCSFGTYVFKLNYIYLYFIYN